MSSLSCPAVIAPCHCISLCCTSTRFCLEIKRCDLDPSSWGQYFSLFLWNMISHWLSKWKCTDQQTSSKYDLAWIWKLYKSTINNRVETLAHFCLHDRERLFVLTFWGNAQHTLVHTLRIVDSQTGIFHGIFIANQELQALIIEWKGNLQHKTSFNPSTLFRW